MVATQENQGAIDLYSRISDPIAAIEKAGSFFAKSGMFGCDRLEQGMVLAMACMAERKSPVEIAATYHLQDGKLSMKAEAMLGRFHAIGGKSKLISRTPEKAEVELAKPDGTKARFEFTLEEAKAEDYVYAKDGKTFKKNWSTPRKRMQMLWARVVSDGVRAMAPEVLNGSYTPEEITEDIGAVEPKPVLQTDKTTPAPATKQEKKIVEAEIVQPAKTETASTEPAPTFVPETAQPVAAQSKEIFIVKTEGIPGDSQFRERLTSETASKIIEVLGNHSEAALQWMVARNWLSKQKIKTEAGESEAVDIRLLSANRAQLILNKPLDFINKVTAATAK